LLLAALGAAALLPSGTGSAAPATAPPASPASAAAAPPPRDSARAVLDLLLSAQVEEAESLLPRVEKSDPERAWAEAALRYWRGDYPGAAAALPPRPAPSEDEHGWLRDRIAAARQATQGMLERREGPFTFRFAPGPDAILVDYGIDALLAQRRVMARILGSEPPQPVVIEILPDIESFILATGLPEQWVRTTSTVAVAKWDRVHLLSPVNMPHGFPWKDTLAHEYVHLALSRASRERAPLWFQEGAARVLESAWRGARGDAWLDPWSETMLARARKEGALIALSDLKVSIAAMPSNQLATLAFAQVAFAVDQLLDAAGEAGFRRAVEEMARSGDADRAMDLGFGTRPGDPAAAETSESRYLRALRSAKLSEKAQIQSFDVEIEDGAARQPDPEGRGVDPVLVADRRMQEHARLGDLLRVRGQTEAALIEYDRASRVGPFHSPALAGKRARALRALGRNDVARQALEESVTLYPEFTPNVSLLAELAVGSGDDARAVELCRQAIGLNPFDPDVHLLLSGLFGRRGDRDGQAHEQRVLQVLADHFSQEFR
jgi:tetratricopeptide (TPR) repeat protein